jgi:hypothetical protein
MMQYKKTRAGKEGKIEIRSYTKSINQGSAEAVLFILARQLPHLKVPCDHLRCCWGHLTASGFQILCVQKQQTRKLICKPHNIFVLKHII